MIKLYGYKRCSTCVKAEKALAAKKIDYTFIDITLQPPKKTELKKIIQATELPIDKFYNTSGKKYKELDIKTKRKEMDEKAQIEMLSGDGYLLKRPLVFDGERASVGFKEEEFKKLWK